MITIQSKIDVQGISGVEIFNFLMNPTDHTYQDWWPGTHLEFHYLHREPNYTGSVIYMDEWVGKYRLKASAVVAEVKPGRKLVWQIRKGIRLPIWLTLELNDHPAGVALVHTIHAGFQGLGMILDPLFRIYFSSGFARAMDEHAQSEFPRLRDMFASATLDT